MFETLKEKVSQKFLAMQSVGALYTVDYDLDRIWEIYLDAFATEEIRQSNRCSCCRSFIRQVGGVVCIDPTNKLHTLWGLDDVPEEYAASVAALNAYVLSLPIAGLYRHEENFIGTDKTPDSVRGVVWQHFYVKTPAAARALTASAAGEKRTDKEVMERGLKELTPDAFTTVLELIGQDSLYRGNEWAGPLTTFQRLQKDYLDLPEDQRSNFCWRIAATLSAAIARLRNTSMGQLLIDLSEGKELEQAVKAFEAMVGGANYKRPTALATPKMIESARQKLESLGLTSALHRRRLDTRDLTPERALYVFTPKAPAGRGAHKDVFAALTEESPVDMKTLSKVETVSIADFVEKVLPTAKAVRVLFEHAHMSNLVTLTGPQDPEANNLFQWDSSFGWSYTGGVADSVKQRVKAAGGNVDGWMRISLSWFNYDDLDLHMTGAGEHVGYSSKHSHKLQATLDVDMNVSPTTREAVENIHVLQQLPQGTYTVYVTNFTRREDKDTGFELEIEVNGQVHSFGAAKSPPRSQSTSDPADFTVLPDGAVAFKDSKLVKSSAGISRWGLTTGRWASVRAITKSPNHWDHPTGLLHWFFLLEGCTSDEATRGFYNEFLTEDLQAERKTMEMLAGRVEVLPAVGAELSGLGFSESRRHHLYVEVESAFKRVIKVTF